MFCESLREEGDEKVVMEIVKEESEKEPLNEMFLKTAVAAVMCFKAVTGA